MLKEVTECVHCGCADLAENSRYSAGLSQVFDCNHCGKMTMAGDEEPEPIREVEYQRTACPHCESMNTTTRSGSRVVGGSKRRYHTCNDCHKTFRSKES